MYRFMRQKSSRKEKGYTLIELLIGLGVGVFLLASSLYVYTVLMSSFYSLMSANRLEHQLRTAMNTMVQNIRRAGYSASALTSVGTGTNTNPFMASGTDLSVPASTCILFSYDTNITGTLSALSTAGSDERFGFRLSNNTLQARASTDAQFNCNSGTWVDITAPNLIQVTALTFILTPTVIALNPAGDTLTIRTVIITMSGSLVSDPSVTQTMTQTVRVRNDKFSSSS